MLLKFVLSKVIYRRKGFTIIELVTVLSIIGVVITITLPVFHSTLSKYKLETSAYAIASDMRRIQQKTISEGKFYRLKFNIYLNSYSVLLGTSEEIKELPDGIRLVTTNFENHTLSFQVTGAPNRAGTVIIKNADGRFMYIIVEVATGRVRVSDKPPESWR